MKSTLPLHHIASIIIVSYNTCDILRHCLHSVQTAIGALQIKVIVVDNASEDNSAEMVATDFPHVTLIRNAYNVGFAAANNQAWSHCQGNYTILLNPDTHLEQNALLNAIEHMDANPQVALAGGRLLNMQQHDEPAARCFPSLLNELLVLSGLAARFPNSRFFGRFDRSWADPQQAAAVDWVPGAFSIIRHAAIFNERLFDERFFLYYEEVDLCRRLQQAGWQIYYWPDIIVHHIGGASSRTVRNQAFNHQGSQLLLWRNQSCLLYFHKHYGACYTRLIYQLHLNWQQLRQFKNRRNLAKSEFASQAKQCWRRAWQATHGGSSSPQRPWSSH